MPKNIRRRLPLVIILGVLLVAILLTRGKTHSNLGIPTSITTQPATVQDPATVNIESPLRLKIPKINVDSALEYVVLTPQGDVGAPSSITNAAWYSRGVRPGEKGSAVIDGHYGWIKGVPAVFNDLHKLKPGDSLYTEGDRGTTTTFIVRKLQTYSPNDPVPAVFASTDGGAHLNLITCQGDWDASQKSYSDRLVVFTDKQ